MQKQANGSIREYAYHPHGKPLPKGWRLASDLQGTRHGHHAVLIVKENEKEANKAKRKKAS